LTKPTTGLGACDADRRYRGRLETKRVFTIPRGGACRKGTADEKMVRELGHHRKWDAFKAVKVKDDPERGRAIGSMEKTKAACATRRKEGREQGESRV